MWHLVGLVISSAVGIFIGVAVYWVVDKITWVRLSQGVEETVSMSVGEVVSVVLLWLLLGLPRQRRVLRHMALGLAAGAVLMWPGFNEVRSSHLWYAQVQGLLAIWAFYLLPPAGALVGHTVGQRQRSAE